MQAEPGRSLAATLALAFLACAGRPPETLGLHGSALSPCPASRNCVASDATDRAHRVPPFELAIAPDEAWPLVRSAVASMPRTAVAAEAPDYLRAECTSAVFRFVDDLELQLRASEGVVAVRSASRLGADDLGVNRARVEKLRALLVASGAVRPLPNSGAGEDPVSALPYCEETAAAGTPPEASCAADPAFVAFREEIEGFVVPRAGPLLVWIRLDDRARIEDACAVRGYGTGQWTARHRLAELLASPLASSSGPACAAGSRLEFNRAEATYEQIEIIGRDCARQSRSPRLYAECIRIWQQRRGEIWVFGSTPKYRVFTPIGEPSPRRSALLACTEPNPAAGSTRFPPVGIARPSVDLEACMESEGWRELK